MNEKPRNRAERRAGRMRINPRVLAKAIVSLEYPLEERKVWAAMLSQYCQMSKEEAKELQDMAENPTGALGSLLKDLPD